MFSNLEAFFETHHFGRIIYFLICYQTVDLGAMAPLNTVNLTGNWEHFQIRRSIQLTYIYGKCNFHLDH